MKPIKLTMTAFGPYMNTTVLDFQRDLQDNIFVITGATGAGKTTIFDAICYALYGETSDNNGRAALELRSHFSGEQTEKTSVELIFEVRGQQYYVKRTPPQLRKKARGEGWTEEKHSVEFKALNTDTPTKTGAEVGAEITALLGLTAVQFKRIVMLPQGAFREFLQDSTANKTELLRKLFDTVFYDNLTESLKEKTKEASEEIRDLEKRIQTHLSHIYLGEHEPLTQLLQEQAPLTDILKELVVQNKLVAKTIVSKKTVLQDAVSQLATQEKELEQARKWQELQNEQQQLQHKLAELQRTAEDIATMEQRCTQIEIALQNQARYNLLQRTSAETQEYRNKVQQAQETIPTIAAQEALLKTKLDNLPQWEEAQRQADAEIIQLNNYQQKLQQLQLAQNEQSILHNTAQKIQLQQAFHEQQSKYAQLNSQLALLLELHKIMVHTNELETALQDCLQKHAAWQEEITNIEKSIAHKRELFLNSASIVLAQSLKQGAPCPVCGSCEHPAPPATDVLLPTRAELQTLEKELQAHKQQADLLQKKQGELQQELYQGRNKEHSLRSHADIKELFADPTHDYNLNWLVQLGKQLRDQAAQVAMELKANGIELQATQTQESLLENALRTQQELASKQGIIELLLAELPPKYIAQNNLPAEIATQKSISAQFKKDILQIRESYAKVNLDLNTWQSNLANWTTSWERLQKNTSELLAEHELFLTQHFRGEQDIFIEILSFATELPTWKKQVQDYKNNELVTTERLLLLNDLLKNTHDIDLQTLEQNVSHNKELINDLNVHIATLSMGLEHNRKIQRTVLADQQLVQQKQEEFKIIATLAKLTGGNNPTKTKLEAFVLSAYFDDVLAQANARLQKMTDNQYSLVRRANSGGGGFKGLELNVYDTHTCKERSVSTLSGGESFKAALSLALGLSDVVQANAGGIRLDTMLIDEGFGTLDEESLDSAMDTLMDLQEHGRIIGVISHVPALKKRITSKLNVQKTAHGSEAWFSN